MDREIIYEIVCAHELWLKTGGKDGERANFRGADLQDIDLINANLQGAKLKETYLRRANLQGADLQNANLQEANLQNADLQDANLKGANLRGANLQGANLQRANLQEADLRGANLEKLSYDFTTAYFAMQCPEKGSYIGYKKAQNRIIELEITSDALRSSATTRKCRASKAEVLSITDITGEKEFKSAISNHDRDFVYRVGEIVEVNDFDPDRWNECSTGIHHFITREEAVSYQ